MNEKKPRFFVRIPYDPEAEIGPPSAAVVADKRRPQKVPDERWVAALSAADSNNLRELVRALLVVAPIPDWVREELRPLFKDERPLTAAQRRLKKGVELFRKLKAAQAGKRHQLSDHDLIAKAAAAAGTTDKGLYNIVVRFRGAAYNRIRRQPTR